MSEIFISYAHEDRERAKRLVELLEAEGFSVFWDRELLPGERYRDVIAAELAAARCVITLWSHTSIKRDWVIDEAEAGLRRGLLVSVLVDPVPLPLGFGQGHAADLSAWKQRRDDPVVRELVRGIRALVDGSDSLASSAPAPSGTGTPSVPPSAVVAPQALSGGPSTQATPASRRHPHLVPALLLVAAFVANLLQTAVDPLLTPASLGASSGYPMAKAFRWFEGYVSFEGHDATNSVAYVGSSISYFFLFPALAVAVAWALARRTNPLPFRTFSIAVAIDYAISLPFFMFLPVPERWAQPDTSALLLSDKWSDALIEAIRPMSGLDNCFPSFHVSLTVLLVSACFLFRLRLRVAAAALGATIVLATFVLGIHWLPDIIAGGALGLGSLLLARRWVQSGRPATEVPAALVS